MVLYDKVKSVAKEKHIAIRQIEFSCGIAQGSIAKWNKVSPSVNTLKKVADCLGVTVAFLLGEGECRNE